MVSYFDHLLTNITKNGRDGSTRITSDQNGKVLYDQTQGYLSLSRYLTHLDGQSGN